MNSNEKSRLIEIIFNEQPIICPHCKFTGLQKLFIAGTMMFISTIKCPECGTEWNRRKNETTTICNL